MVASVGRQKRSVSAGINGDTGEREGTGCCGMKCGEAWSCGYIWIQGLLAIATAFSGLWWAVSEISCGANEDVETEPGVYDSRNRTEITTRNKAEQ